MNKDPDEAWLPAPEVATSGLLESKTLSRSGLEAAVIQEGQSGSLASESHPWRAVSLIGALELFFLFLPLLFAFVFLLLPLVIAASPVANQEQYKTAVYDAICHQGGAMHRAHHEKNQPHPGDDRNHDFRERP